jgi:hypothetical protein
MATTCSASLQNVQFVDKRACLLVKSDWEPSADLTKNLNKRAIPTAATGPAGHLVEAGVGARYLVAMLLRDEPRGLPYAIIEKVQFQGANHGFALDDIIVHARSPDGRPQILEIQVKRSLGFSRTNRQFKSVCQQLAQSLASPDGATRKYVVAVDRPAANVRSCNDALELARAMDARTFWKNIRTKGAANQTMRQFCETVRANLAAAKLVLDDEQLWQVFRQFEIHEYDFTAGAPEYQVSAIARLGEMLRPEDAHRKRDLWDRLCMRVLDLASKGGVISRDQLSEDLSDFPARTSGPRDSQPRIVKRLTSVTAQTTDLANQVQASHGAAGRAVRLSDDLYVKRIVEEKIVAHLRKSNELESFVVLVGEPGTGKSSILWALATRRDIAADRRVWLTSAGDLIDMLDDEGDRKNKQLDELSSVLHLYAKRGRRSVLLIDTADVALNNAQTARRLRDLLGDLKDMPVTVVIASRPEEADYLDYLDPLRFLVEGYQGEELHEALLRYSQKYVERKDEQIVYLERMENAVAQGLPIAEVARNPLALQMLYAIYAPEQINYEDVNIVSLYAAYWDRRVRADIRQGRRFNHAESADLSALTLHIGLAMLAEGRPELTQEQLGGYLARVGMNKVDVETLVRRGVLRDAPHDRARRYTFFHQTFFEHAAALAIVQRLKQQGLDDLTNRYIESQGNEFLGAVLEKALVLAEAEPVEVRTRAKGLTYRLCDLGHRFTGPPVYIFSHQSQSDPALSERLGHQFGQQNQVAIERFFLLFGNVPLRRRVDCLDLVEQVMAGADPDDHRVFELAAFVLAKVARHVPTMVRDSLDKNPTMTERLLLQNTRARNHFIDVIEHITRADPAWGQKRISKYVPASLEGGFGENISERIIGERLIKFMAEEMPRDRLLSNGQIEAMLASARYEVDVPTQKHLARIRFDNGAEETIAAGDLLLDHSERSRKNKLLYVKLLSLAHALLNTDPSVWLAALAEHAHVKDRYLAQGLAGVTWPYFMELLHANNSSAFDIFRERLAEYLRDAVPGTLTETHRFVITMIRESDILLQDISSLFPDDLATTIDFWTSQDFFQDRLARAVLLGVPGARVAIERLAKTESINPKLKSRAAQQFGNQELAVPTDLAQIVLSLSQPVDDAEVQIQMLRVLSHVGEDQWSAWPNIIQTYEAYSRRRYDRRPRACASRFEVEFERLGHPAAVNMDILKSRIEEEKDQQILSHFFDILYLMLRSHKVWLSEEQIIWLVSMSAKSAGPAKTALIKAVCSAIEQNPAARSATFNVVVDYALDGTSQPRDANPISRLLYIAIETDEQLVRDFCITFIRRAPSLPRKTVQRSYIRYSKLFLMICRKSPASWTEQLLENIPKMSADFNRILVPCLQYLPEDRAKAVMAGLARLPLDSLTVKQVEDTRRRLERRNGIEPWPEIYAQAAGNSA